ncbi:MAG: hypothetical protein WBC18_12080 [Ottowia sp.]|uniref:hypothetical protein n=1 Tax=Ottowia sp. TaxID=1898956 RepID=UPI003C736961
MSLTSKLVALGLIILAIFAGVWKLWHTADKAGYERSQREYQAAAEKQREANRATASKAEKNEAARVVYRDRIITKTITEVRDASAPLAACPVPSAVVRMLNDAAQRAREDRSAPGSVDYSLSHPG